jgi:hypothetical protein
VIFSQIFYLISRVLTSKEKGKDLMCKNYTSRLIIHSLFENLFISLYNKKDVRKYFPMQKCSIVAKFATVASNWKTR